MARFIAGFVAGLLAAVLIAFPVESGSRNCKPAWKCQSATITPTVRATVTTTTAPTVAPATSTPAPTSSYSFDDECSGSSLDPRWSSLYGPGDPGDRLDTDMSAPVTATQVSVANGLCTITVERKTTPSGRPFAAATISTRGAFSQRYGTWETRFRYDTAHGTWPSFWTLPANWPTASRPEVDVVESIGDPACLGPGLTQQVLHYSLNPPLYTITNWPEGVFHVVKLVWTPSRLDFYIDGSLTWSVTDASKVPQVALFPLYTYGVGAPLTPQCRADATTPSPLHMDIDYLRVSP